VAQANLQVIHYTRQVQAIGEICLHVRDDAFRGVYGQATEVVQGAGFAGLDRDAGLGVSRAVGRFVAQQAGSGVVRAQASRGGAPLGLPGSLVAELMGGSRA